MVNDIAAAVSEDVPSCVLSCVLRPDPVKHSSDVLQRTRSALLEEKALDQGRLTPSTVLFSNTALIDSRAGWIRAA